MGMLSSQFLGGDVENEEVALRLERKVSAKFADGKAAGELQEIHHLGYNAIGLFGAHQYHHVVSDRLDKTHADLVAPVVSALQDTLLRYKSR